MMVAYNFKAKFSDDVEQGRKRQTIRRRRKRPTMPGDRLQLYVGMRTKNCRLLRVANCLSVEPIEIGDSYVKINGQRLGFTELFNFAGADGFTNHKAFFRFFEKQYGLPLPDDFEVIKWEGE